MVLHWRRQYQERTLADTGLIPVVMTEDALTRQALARTGAASIRIELPGGTVVVVDGSADSALVRMIVESPRA